jgi:hypothetical protein
VKNIRAIFVLAVLFGIQGCVSLDLVHVKTSTWGDKSLVTEEAVKKIEYNGDYKWGGVVIGAVFPVPLVIPYGKESTTSWWVGEQCVYSETTDTWATGYGCNVQYEKCGKGVTWGTLMFNLDAKSD